MKKIVFGLVLIFFTPSLFSQNWVNKMMDPNVNFHEVKDGFNAHWGQKGYERGKGWKQYKRWEYMVESRSYPTGERNHSKTYLEAWKQAQKMSQSQQKSNSDWQPVGPVSWESQGWNPGLGRINAIIVDPNDASRIYAATPAGGLWKSINSGSDWTPITDNLPAIGASGLAIDPSDSDILYLATGDGDGSDTYSFGVMKSTNGGDTWETTSLVHNVANEIRCTKILIDPTDSQKLWVSTNQGLFVSQNAGLSWSQSISHNVRDIELKPGDSNVVYCSGRKFYKSTDGGLNFNEITDGVPNSSAVNRLAITVSNDDPSIVYMVAGSDEDSGFYGLYRSTDSGDSFELRSDSPNILTYSEIGDGDGGQSWYDLAIAASQTDADEIYVGGINVWKSNNGGLDWTITSHWVHPSNIGYTHADIHTLDVYGDKVYCGSDGGIFVSSNQGNSWTDLSEGLQISQFYKIAISTTNPEKILTASQDNGTNLFSSPTSYNHLLGGDGNMALIDYSNDQIMYSAYPGGSFQRSTDGGTSFQNFTDGMDESGIWVSPLEMHPTNNTILFAALENVWKVGIGGTWEPISDFPFSGTLRTLAIAPSNADVIYTSTSSTIMKTTNGGANWTGASSGLPNLTITDIEVHPDDPDELWVTMSGYNADSKVFHSINGGQNWENISLNLPNIPVNCVSYQVGSNDGIYIGTDVGVYYKDADNINWSSFNDGLPNVIINQIVFQYQSSKVLLATYGRGVWENDFFDPGSVVPVVNFAADKQIICMGETVDYLNQSINITSNILWTFDGGSPAQSTEVSPTITYNQSGIFQAKLWAANENGADSLIYENYIHVLDTSGLPTPYSEDFEAATSVDDTDWFIENLDGLNTWALNENTGYESDKSMWLNNFTNLPTNYDYLNSATFDLADLDTAFITMRVAYAKKTNSSTETLGIYISTDCGESWTYKMGFHSSSTLNTADPTDSPFVPADETEWKLLVIDNIQPDERTSNFRIRLRFKSNGGNNIYVDDINIVNSLPTSINEPNAIFESLSLFPNPTIEFATINLTARNATDAKIKLYDGQGKLAKSIWNGKISEGVNSIQLPLKGIAAGVYTLSILANDGVVSRQLVIGE